MPKKNQKKFDNESKDDYNPEEDIIFDQEGHDGSSDHRRNEKKLREKLKKAVEEKQEYLEGWQRARADFVNYKREEGERKIEILRFAKEEFIRDLLPILDSFNMAKESNIWNDGLEQIHRQFLEVLLKNDLKELDPLSEDFDPNFHEAIEMTSESKENDGKVMEVLQKGYLLNQKIIRPAKVKVGKFEK